jgi:Flp pilus assembly protein TadG
MNVFARARQFARNRRGNVGMLFAFSLPVLVLMVFGAVDIHRATTVQMNLQDALDAAALAAARSNADTNAEARTEGMKALKANLAGYPRMRLREADTEFVLTDNNRKVVASARVNVDTLVASVFLAPFGQYMQNELELASKSEVSRASRNIEVALVLDTTGSMAGQKINDLKLAAKDLVDVVVQDQQSPWTSRVALVPYSMGVNLGQYADAARGQVTGSVNITDIGWSSGQPKAISAATKANPVQITSAAHGFSNGDVVWISGVAGMSQLNNTAFKVASVTTNTFILQTMNGQNVDGRWYSTYVAGGTVRKCRTADCEMVVTAAGHGLRENDYVYLTDVVGLSSLNNATFQVSNVTANTYSIAALAGTNQVYASGGKSWCAQAGCTYQAYTNVYGNLQTQRISTCVSERSGANAYTDVASTGNNRVWRNYPNTGNVCLPNLMRPLTSNRTDLKNQIDSLVAVGSTAGQVGVAWGWYALSPNFNNLWGAGTAAAYDQSRTIKAAVIMTDGEYNSGYCNGVISADSTNGSGSPTYHINCNAPNGHPYNQSIALCRAMQQAGVTVYVVGFQVENTPQARDLVNNCASSSQHVYMASSGQDLRNAFVAIGRDIQKLRISK